MAKPQYEYLMTLEGARDAVFSVSFSPDAKFVAATGFNGVSIWKVGTATEPMSLVALPTSFASPPNNACAVYPTSGWLYFRKASQHTLILGSMDGKVQAWDWVADKKAFLNNRKFAPQTPASEVSSLAVYQVDVTGKLARVAAAFIDHSVLIWTLPADGDFQFKHAVKLDFLAKTIRFDSSKNLHAFAMQGGKITLLDYNSGSTIWTKTRGPKIMGYVSVSQSDDYFVVHTGKGIELFDLSNLNHIRSYKGPVPIVQYPKQVVFAENETRIVGGTDRGEVVIYNMQAGTMVQVLMHPDGGLVQSVATVLDHTKVIFRTHSVSFRCQTNCITFISF